MSKKVIYSIVGVVIVLELVVEMTLLVNTNEYRAEQINTDEEVTVDLGTKDDEEVIQDTVTEDTQIEVLSDDEL